MPSDFAFAEAEIEELTKRRGSSIFVEVIIDLAELVQQIEQNSNLSPQDTRDMICDAIEAGIPWPNSRCRLHDDIEEIARKGPSR